MGSTRTSVVSFISIWSTGVEIALDKLVHRIRLDWVELELELVHFHSFICVPFQIHSVSVSQVVPDRTESGRAGVVG